MTSEEKYAALLKEVGELLEKKNNTISMQESTINYLRETLEKVEKERDFFKERAELLSDEPTHTGCEYVKGA